MRRKLVAGNWKMQGRQAANAALVQALVGRAAEWAGVDMWLAPPAPYLLQVAGLLVASPLVLAAQNVSHEDDGACTGEVSAGMLADCGCHAVLVAFGAADALCGNRCGGRRKICARPGGGPDACALCRRNAGRARAGQTEAVVARQLAAVITDCP